MKLYDKIIPLFRVLPDIYAQREFVPWTGIPLPGRVHSTAYSVIPKRPPTQLYAMQ